MVGLLLTGVPLIAQSQLNVEDVRQSFGKVKKGELVLLYYRVTNVGTTPVTISEAKVSCSCTSAKFTDQPVLPGAVTTVTVTFDTKSAYGRQDRIVELYSSDPKSPLKLRFKGTVDPN